MSLRNRATIGQYEEMKLMHLTIYLTQETLTGFKWMGNLACDLMAQGKTVLFTFEEAIGEK